MKLYKLFFLMSVYYLIKWLFTHEDGKLHKIVVYLIINMDAKVDQTILYFIAQNRNLYWSYQILAFLKEERSKNQ